MDKPEPLGLLIVAARQGIRHAISAHARRLRLTTQQFWAIVALHEAPGLSPGDLGDRLVLDAPAASRLVALLVRRRLVDVKPDRSDRRRTRIFLTASGAATARRIAPTVQAFRMAIVRGLAEQEVAFLCDALGRVVANLAAFEAGAVTEPPRRVARAS